MEIIVGYLFGVLYYKLCCVYSLESPHRGDSNECTQHTFAIWKKKMSLNYPFVVFGGNPCGLKNVFDSSMVNEPSGFEPLKFYCIQLNFGNRAATCLGKGSQLCFCHLFSLWLYNCICLFFPFMFRTRFGSDCIIPEFTYVHYKSTCASAQSDQSSLCPLDETLHPWLSKMRSVKILIRLRECAGLSKSSLGAHVRRYVFWCCGSCLHGLLVIIFLHRNRFKTGVQKLCGVSLILM